ncbi:MAG: GIY-YIG nuclease family protein [Planctomycetes bacterium]|nr:GIY-YIG nuclease family protein [Planctomycetota bacterium]
MSPSPQTIQIFLPGGDPCGLRIAEITTRIVQLIEVPRSLLDAFLAMSESEQVAVYFLVGAAEDGGEPKLYVGQTGDLRARLATHHKAKEFWERALVLISKTRSLTQTHTLFLEWFCLQQAKEVGRYLLENGNAGSKPHTPAPLEADCLEIFATGRTLLATLGHPLFEPLAATQKSGADELFHCTGLDAKGRGLYTPDGFVVLKGSTARKGNVPSLAGTGSERFRERLVQDGILAPDGDHLVFTKDYLFRSPSMAAIALLGRNANGWDSWRTADDRTLDEVKRSGGGSAA